MSERPAAQPRGGIWPAAAAAALLVCFGVGADYFQWFTQFRYFVGTEAVPQALARLGRSGKALKLLEYDTSVGTRLKGFEQEMLPQDMPSTTILDPEIVQTGVPIVSLVVDPEDLLGQDHGIVVHFNKKGRSWERPAFATFFRDAEIEFATGAGVRVHGGKSRLYAQKSFQLRFRKLYGEGNAPLSLIDDESLDSIKSLVIHSSLLVKNKSRTFHYVNPIAYEVADRIGCIVPRWTPVKFYLNGEYQGPYVLTERITRDFLEARYGHSEFVVFDTRSSDLKHGSRSDIAELLSWSKPENIPDSMAEINEKVDLANLTNWYLSIMYGGTTDPFQGFAVRDKTRNDGRWFWINWDMDHSFVDLYSKAEHPWEVDSFSGMGNLLGNKKDARTAIFKKLISVSKEYREYFLARLTETLNHDLDQHFMDGLIERYRQTGTSMGFERTDLQEILVDYARYRPAVLRKLATEYLSAGPSYMLSVTSSSSAAVRIDGRRVSDLYEGWYFETTPARLELDDGADARNFSWQVNGIPVGPAGRVLTLHLKTNTTVELVPADA